MELEVSRNMNTEFSLQTPPAQETGQLDARLAEVKKAMASNGASL